MTHKSITETKWWQYFVFWFIKEAKKWQIVQTGVLCLHEQKHKTANKNIQLFLQMLKTGQLYVFLQNRRGVCGGWTLTLETHCVLFFHFFKGLGSFETWMTYTLYCPQKSHNTDDLNLFILNSESKRYNIHQAASCGMIVLISDKTKIDK